MRFHSGITAEGSSTAAIEQLVAEARAGTGGRTDLVFFFFTTHHVEEADELIERLWLQLDPECILGCSAEGVIGGDQEIEQGPGMAMLAGAMPGVRVHPFHIADDDWPGLLAKPTALADRLGLGDGAAAIVAFGDPFTTPVEALLEALNSLAPGVPLLGGMASSGTTPGRNVLVRNDQAFNAGLVGVTLAGPVRVDPLVSQGAMPVGRPLVITKGHDNIIEQLAGRPAVAAIQEMIAQLSPAEQELLPSGLLVGRAVSEYRESFGRGDFLIRNLLGLDETSGAVAVADRVRVGQTIQFHLRDARSADEDLIQLLQSRSAGNAPAGALLFSCNGRGTRLFPSPGHDIGAARQTMPQTPVAGFFAAGEFGPVGGQNFIHGHTASFALFRPAKP